MTLIYGANAAGKSSYVRALKRLCRSVDRDTEVLGSIYESVENSATPPRVGVTYQTEGKTHSCEVKLSSGQAVGLASISVFDSACAELYVDSTNTISFVPSGLKLLTRMATAQGQMRNNIQVEIRR
jgi:recombinational DNA repair ATPase RecF